MDTIEDLLCDMAIPSPTSSFSSISDEEPMPSFAPHSPLFSDEDFAAFFRPATDPSCDLHQRLAETQQKLEDTKKRYEDLHTDLLTIKKKMWAITKPCNSTGQGKYVALRMKLRNIATTKRGPTTESDMDAALDRFSRALGRVYKRLVVAEGKHSDVLVVGETNAKKAKVAL